MPENWFSVNSESKLKSFAAESKFGKSCCPRYGVLT